MSDANRTAVRYVEELTPGTTPASPAFTEMRILSSDLGTELNTVVSNELRADRQITDLIQVGQTPGGTVPFELHFNALDDLARGAFQSEWLQFPVRDNFGSADSQITDLVAGTGVVTVAAAGSDYRRNAGTYQVGHVVRHSGFTNAGNNGLYRISAATATSYTIPTAGLVNETAPPAAARSKVVAIQGIAGDIAATATGLTSTALNWATLGVVAGMWIKIGGPGATDTFATAPANNGWARVGAVNAGTLTLDILPAGWGVDAGAGRTIMVFVGDAIRNGVTPRSYTFEEEFTDLGEFHYYRGAQLNTLQMNVSAQEILTGSVEALALSSPVPGARVAGATTLAAGTGDVLAASAGVGQLLENGAPLGANVPMALSLNITNTLRRRNAVGVSGSASIGTGRFNVTGSLNTYYGSNAILTKARNSTATSFMLRAVDPSGTRGWIIDLPRIKFGNANPSVPGIDQDRMLEVPIQGLRAPALGYTMQLQRFEEHT